MCVSVCVCLCMYVCEEQGWVLETCFKLTLKMVVCSRMWLAVGVIVSMCLRKYVCVCACVHGTGMMTCLPNSGELQ